MPLLTIPLLPHKLVIFSERLFSILRTLCAIVSDETTDRNKSVGMCQRVKRSDIHRMIAEHSTAKNAYHLAQELLNECMMEYVRFEGAGALEKMAVGRRRESAMEGTSASKCSTSGRNPYYGPEATHGYASGVKGTSDVTLTPLCLIPPERSKGVGIVRFHVSKSPGLVALDKGDTRRGFQDGSVESTHPATRYFCPSVEEGEEEVITLLAKGNQSYAKRLFREIALCTHPDKCRALHTNGAFVRARGYHQEGKLLSLLVIAQDLGIEPRYCLITSADYEGMLGERDFLLREIRGIQCSPLCQWKRGRERK
jgi:hypothetical protein